MVILVINNPKLPRLIAEYILIDRAVKNIGYTTNNGTLGTVIVNVIATAKFNAQLIVSIVSLNGLLFQSC